MKMRNIHRPVVVKREDGVKVASCPCGWASEQASNSKAEQARWDHIESVWTCSVCGTKVSAKKNGWDRWSRPDGGVDHARCHGGETKDERQSRHLRERREHREASRSFVLRGDDRYAPLGGGEPG